MVWVSITILTDINGGMLELGGSALFSAQCYLLLIIFKKYTYFIYSKIYTSLLKYKSKPSWFAENHKIVKRQRKQFKLLKSWLALNFSNQLKPTEGPKIN